MKYILTILVTALVVSAGAYIYFKGIPSFPPYSRSPIATESALVTPNETQVAAVVTPSASPSGTVVSAGGILSMSAYTINVPSDWASSKVGSVSGQSDKLTLTKGAYSITVSQGAFGGAICLYPGDADAEMAQRYVSFTPLTDQSGDSLRVSSLSTGGFAVCQLSGTSWGDITSFGHISIATPPTLDQSIISQINSMISSLKKK